MRATFDELEEDADTDTAVEKEGTAAAAAAAAAAAGPESGGGEAAEAGAADGGAATKAAATVAAPSTEKEEIEPQKTPKTIKWEAGVVGMTALGTKKVFIAYEDGESGWASKPHNYPVGIKLN